MDFKNLVDSNTIKGIMKDVIKQINSDLYVEFTKINDRLDKIEEALIKLNEQSARPAVPFVPAPAHEVDNNSQPKHSRKTKNVKICSIDGCSKPAKCKGFCLYHYQCSRKQIREQEASGLQSAEDNEVRRQEILNNIKPVIRRKDETIDTENIVSAESSVSNNETIVTENRGDENLHPSFQPIV